MLLSEILEWLGNLRDKKEHLTVYLIDIKNPNTILHLIPNINNVHFYRYMPVIPALQKLMQEDHKFGLRSKSLSQQNKMKH